MQVGNYRYLLMAFAIVDIFISIVHFLVVPVWFAMWFLQKRNIQALIMTEAGFIFIGFRFIGQSTTVGVCTSEYFNCLKIGLIKWIRLFYSKFLRKVYLQICCLWLYSIRRSLYLLFTTFIDMYCCASKYLCTIFNYLTRCWFLFFYFFKTTKKYMKKYRCRWSNLKSPGHNYFSILLVPIGFNGSEHIIRGEIGLSSHWSWTFSILEVLSSLISRKV